MGFSPRSSVHLVFAFAFAADGVEMDATLVAAASFSFISFYYELRALLLYFQSIFMQYRLKSWIGSILLL